MDTYLDSVNRLGLSFMDDKNSISAGDTFDLFCEVFGVDERDAIDFINGRKFILKKEKT